MFLLAGCSSGEGESSVFALDGRARIPDDQGIVTAVELDEITLDGSRTYGIDEDLVSFSAIDLSVQPLLFTDRQFVQVGLEDDTVVWVGAVARPVGSPPFVTYTGVIESIDENGDTGRRARFDSGTVLGLSDDLDEVPTDELVRVEVDVSTALITSIVRT